MKWKTKKISEKITTTMNKNETPKWINSCFFVTHNLIKLNFQLLTNLQIYYLFVCPSSGRVIGADPYIHILTRTVVAWWWWRYRFELGIVWKNSIRSSPFFQMRNPTTSEWLTWGDKKGSWIEAEESELVSGQDSIESFGIPRLVLARKHLFQDVFSSVNWWRSKSFAWFN